MTQPYKSLYDRAQAYDAHLDANDPRFNQSVVVREHYTGSFLFFESAFAVKCEDFTFVFTEHLSFHVYCTEDYDIRVYVEQGIPTME